MKCSRLERQDNILDKIIKADVHLLLVVKEEDNILGIIFLSDILQIPILTHWVPTKYRRQLNDHCA